jgi:hypothetical protein
MLNAIEVKKLINRKRKALVRANQKEPGIPTIYTLFFKHPELMKKNIGRIRSGRKKPFGRKVHKAILLQIGSQNAVNKIYIDRSLVGAALNYDSFTKLKKYGNVSAKIKMDMWHYYVGTIESEIHLVGFESAEDIMEFNAFKWYQKVLNDTVNKYTEESK